MNIAVLVMAAGRSLRFGEDKLAVNLQGVPLGVRTLRLLNPFPFTQRVLITSKDKQYLLEEGERLGFQAVVNPHPEEGQSLSVRLGLHAILQNGTPDGVLFSVADQPNLSGSTVQRVIDAFMACPASIVIPTANGHRGNPVIFPGDILDELMHITGDKGGSQVIGRHPERIVTVEVFEQDLMDIDTKEDLSHVDGL